MKYVYQISFSRKEKQKRLEDYFFEVTGKRPNFGPLDYGGTGTIIVATENLRNYYHNNITGAIYFPGKRFHEVDDFIRWHSIYQKMCCSFVSRDSETLMMNILTNLKKVKTYNDIYTDSDYTLKHGSRYLYRCSKCGKFVLVQRHYDKKQKAYVTEYIPVINRKEAESLIEKYTSEELMKEHKNKMFSICIKDYNWI